MKPQVDEAIVGLDARQPEIRVVGEQLGRVDDDRAPGILNAR